MSGVIVDNFDQILDLLEFNNKNEFYFVQVIQRKKDGNVTGKGNNGSRTIKTYYCFSREYLERKREKIIELCKLNNARAYIHLNRRNSREVAAKCVQVLGEHLMNETTEQCSRVWDHATGKQRAKGYKPLWLVDVDTDNIEVIERVYECIYDARPEGHKVVAKIPTLQGYHLITTGFDSAQFGAYLEDYGITDISIQKDNPTLLYYDNNGRD